MICNIKVRPVIISFLLCCPVFLVAQSKSVKQTELINFQLQSSAVVSENGKELSTSAYHSRVYWFPVKVPSTVLTGLIANKVYPNPYLGMNNMLIPDASDSFNQQYHLEQYSFLPNDANPWKKLFYEKGMRAGAYSTESG